MLLPLCVAGLYLRQWRPWVGGWLVILFCRTVCRTCLYQHCEYMYSEVYLLLMMYIASSISVQMFPQWFTRGTRILFS